MTAGDWISEDHVVSTEFAWLPGAQTYMNYSHRWTPTSCMHGQYPKERQYLSPSRTESSRKLNLRAEIPKLPKCTEVSQLDEGNGMDLMDRDLPTIGLASLFICLQRRPIFCWLSPSLLYFGYLRTRTLEMEWRKGSRWTVMLSDWSG
jgi:hypothetical protein